MYWYKQKTSNYKDIDVVHALVINRVGDATPHKVFLKFFQDELSSPPAVFSSCAYIPYTNFDTRLVSIGCYGYEI